jgi:hypothetical protein
MSAVVTNDIPPNKIKIQAMTVIDAGRVLMSCLWGAREPMFAAAAAALKPQVSGSSRRILKSAGESWR